MKKKILSLGFIGVSTLFWACADDTSPVAPPPTSYTESSSSVFVGTSSSSAQQQTTPTYSSSATSKDPAVKHVVVTEPAPGVNYPDIYNKEVFCFTEGCEKTVTPPSSSSKAQATSSSNGGGITIDAPENKAPTVNGLKMTDTRDNKTYTLAQVGGKLWMAQDLNYEGSTGECYNEVAANCASNGRLYTFNSAQRACPSGWRLPNREEAQAAINDESYPWSYSGRCKDGDCNFLGQMGFHWTSATPQDGDKNFDSNVGDNYTVIIVEKEPEYAGENKELKFFQVDAKNKRFSVRCVQE